MSDAATLLLFAECVNRQMLTKLLDPFCNAYVKGAFDRSALVFYKSPGAGVGGGVGGCFVRGVDAQRSVDGERCEEEKSCVCVRENRPRKTSWITFQAQQEVNSLLSRGTQEINRHHQHIPTLAQSFQHRKEFGHYVAMGD